MSTATEDRAVATVEAWIDDHSPLGVRMLVDMPPEGTKLYTHPTTIEELRAAAEAHGYMLCRWEPIETAPRDLSSFVSGFMYNLPKNTRWYEFALEADGDFINHDSETLHPPTHWLSGLTPPKEST